jgi:hypothetical protein
MMRKYNHVPHPFVLFCPESGSEEIEEYELRTILVGDGNRFVPHIAHSFIELGRRGIGRDKQRFEVAEIRSEGSPDPIYCHNDCRMRGDVKPEKIQVCFPEEVNERIQACRIELQSPLRLLNRGQLLKRAEFRPLVSALLRRASALLHFHCGQDMEIDFKNLVSLSEEVVISEDHTWWHEQERYSTRQNERLKFGGLMGNFDIRGRLSPFLDLLKLGERIHAGKGTIFGLGKYRIEGLDND